VDAKFWQFRAEEGHHYPALLRVSFIWLAVAYHQGYLAQKFGLAVSRETMERWLRLWAFIFWLDELLDSQPLKHHPQTREVFRRLLKGVPPEQCEIPDNMSTDICDIAVLFHNAAEPLSQAQRDRLVELGLEIADYVPVKAARRWVWPYARGLVREGRLAAMMSELCLTESERDATPRCYRRYVREFRAIGIAGTLHDSATDLGEDLEAGRSKVPPNKLNYYILMAWSVAYSRALLRPWFTRQLYNEMFKHMRQIHSEQQSLFGPA
jgi:hypothetical protein